MLTVLSAVFGAGIAQKLISNLMMIGIAIAILLGTNLVTGLYWYVDGYNTSAAKCQANTIARARDEANRDKEAAITTAKVLQEKLTTLEAREAQRLQEGANDVRDTKPIDGCTVGPIEPPANKLRRQRPQR